MNDLALVQSQAATTPLEAARLYADLGRGREALAALAPALAAAAEPDAFRLASTVLRRLGKPAEARRHAELGLVHWPQEDILHAALAWALYDLELNVAALAAAERAAAIDPQWFGHHYLQAAILSQLGRHVQAEAAARAALRLEPNDANNSWLLGAILYDRSLYDQARHIVRQGLATDPNHPDLIRLDGLLQEERASRVERFRAALRLAPGDGRSRELLHHDDKGWRRDIGLAVGVGLLLLVLHEGQALAPGGVATALFLIAGIWLARPGRREVLWAFCAGSILILATAPSFVALATMLPEALTWRGVFAIFATAIVCFGLGYVAMQTFCLLRTMSLDALELAWHFLLRLRQAHRHGVLREKLAEVLRQRGTYYNLAACILPVGLPLFGRDAGDALVGLFLGQPALLWLAGRLLLPAEQRSPLFILYAIQSFPLGMTLVFTLMYENWAWPARLYAAMGMGLYALLVANRYRQP